MSKTENIICATVCGILARCAFDSVALGGLIATVMASFYVAVDSICKAIRERNKQEDRT